MSSVSPAVDLTRNFFELFGFPVSHDIPMSELTQRYRELQKQLHPDRFAAAAAAEQRWSVQASSFLNDAYQTLSNDLSRAAYLLQLNGISIDEETDTRMAPEFLMEQMELREMLESASTADDPQAALDAIRKQVRAAVQDQTRAFASAAEQADWSAGRSVVRQWQFLDKLLREAKALEERFEA